MKSEEEIRKQIAFLRIGDLVNSESVDHVIDILEWVLES